MFPEQIQKRVDAGMGCGSGIGEGWMELVVQLDQQVAQLDPDYVIDQVKEKFGGLRYYVTLSEGLDKDIRESIYDIIHEAESKSYTICEVCGQPGTESAATGWIATRCEQHKTTK